MKYPINTWWKLRKVVVKSTKPLAKLFSIAVLGVPLPQYLCKGKWSRQDEPEEFMICKAQPV